LNVAKRPVERPPARVVTTRRTRACAMVTAS
jgi:hypothetical protein